LSNKEEVANYDAKIKAIQGNKQTKVVEEPMAKE